jgi:hypothetical protein
MYGELGVWAGTGAQQVGTIFNCCSSTYVFLSFWLYVVAL